MRSTSVRLHEAWLPILAVAFLSLPPSTFTVSTGQARLTAPASAELTDLKACKAGFKAGIKPCFGLGSLAFLCAACRLRRQRRQRSFRGMLGSMSLDTSLEGPENPEAKTSLEPESRRDTWKLSGFEEFMARLVGAPEGPVELAEADYRRFVSDARNQMLTLAKASKPFTLDQSGNAGSIYGIGRREYQRQHGRLNLSRLRGIMAFDSTARTVTVAAKTDFKTLSRYLLDRGFIVPVVPEVDTVTVGGAISGVVMEAASFRHGFVHNTVQGMEVLLPDGQVVFCSREERPELFRAIPHSYGTLGYVLSAQLLVVPAEMEVMLILP